MWWTLLLSLHLASFAAVPMAHPPPRTPRLAWERDLPGGLRSAELSAGEDCIVVTTSTAVSVLNLDGSLRWKRTFARINQWMTAERAAAPAGCDWVAVVGDPSYKYAWVMGRKGSVHFFQTKGTPEGVAVSHGGDRIAVGTAGEHLYLLDQQARLLFHRQFGYGAISLAFSTTDSHLIVSSGSVGLYTRDGEPVWLSQAGDRLSASTDLKWFLVSGESNHGPANGSIILLDQNGKIVWRREGNGPKGVMSPGGSYFVVTDYECPPKAICYGEDVVAGFQVLRPDGGQISRRSWPNGEVIAIADDGLSFLQTAHGEREGIYCLSPEGDLLWSLPGLTYGEEVRELRDLSAFLVLAFGPAEKTHLRFYVRR
jgi:hypothetical protein